MPDTMALNGQSLNLPDSVWQIGSGGEQIEPASIDFSNLTPETFEELVGGFRTVAHAARRHIGEEANRAQLLSYWINGRMIVVYEQSGEDRAEYGAQTLKKLSARLKTDLGRGYSVTNLQYMRRFYLMFGKQQTLSVKLTWSQYVDLMGIDNEAKRSFYAHYALGGLENRVFASTYTTVMPDEEELAEQVRMAIEANERKVLMSGEGDV